MMKQSSSSSQSTNNFRGPPNSLVDLLASMNASTTPRSAPRTISRDRLIAILDAALEITADVPFLDDDNDDDVAPLNLSNRPAAQ